MMSDSINFCKAFLTSQNNQCFQLSNLFKFNMRLAGNKKSNVGRLKIVFTFKSKCIFNVHYK